jgi:hypothetical protein
MSETKWTPGPWTVRFWDILDNRTLEPTGKRRTMIEYQIWPDIKVGRALAELCFENEANARLIAAAPDLYEALIGLLTNPYINLGDLVYQIRERELKGWDGPAVTAWSDAVTAAKAAIKKVKGEL